MAVANTTTRSKQERRRQQAWRLVPEAVELLFQKYPIERIVLFGSLLDSRHFRLHSDIDLAVWGLSDQSFDRALSELSNLSSDFSFDLVQFESAPPSLQQAIIQRGILVTPPTIDNLNAENPVPSSDADQGMNRDAAILCSQIEREVQEIQWLVGSSGFTVISLSQATLAFGGAGSPNPQQTWAGKPNPHTLARSFPPQILESRLVEKNQALLEKFRATNDEDYVGTIALNLHSFYSGLECIFKQIAQVIDGSVPDSSDWHRQLLRQAAAAIRQVRPPVLRLETLAMLNDYCSFRHVVRNLYSFSLKPERVTQLAEELPACWCCVKEDLENFLQALQ